VTARLWAYGRDERPSHQRCAFGATGGDAPPASWYRFSADRKGRHPTDHLSGYHGWMHAPLMVCAQTIARCLAGHACMPERGAMDGYARFNDLYRSGEIREVACMAHVRRKFVGVHRAQGSAIADEAIRRIAQLYAIETEARGSPPDHRVEIRQAKAKPIFDDLAVRLHARLPSISGKSPLAAAIRHALTPAWRGCGRISSTPFWSWTPTRRSGRCVRLPPLGRLPCNRLPIA
jgi:transposase